MKEYLFQKTLSMRTFNVLRVEADKAIKSSRAINVRIYTTDAFIALTKLYLDVCKQMTKKILPYRKLVYVYHKIKHRKENDKNYIISAVDLLESSVKVTCAGRSFIVKHPSNASKSNEFCFCF